MRVCALNVAAECCMNVKYDISVMNDVQVMVMCVVRKLDNRAVYCILV